MFGLPTTATVLAGAPLASTRYAATPKSSVAGCHWSLSHVVPTLPDTSARLPAPAGGTGALVSRTPVVVASTLGPAVALPVASSATTVRWYARAGASPVTVVPVAVPGTAATGAPLASTWYVATAVPSAAAGQLSAAVVSVTAPAVSALPAAQD